MGILNITSDSFYEGSRFLKGDRAIEKAEQMIQEGADILDIGGISTRPGSNPVGASEEWNRIENVLKPLRKKFPEILLSVDTYRSDIAKRVVTEYQVDFINDISSGDFDEHMLETVALLKVPYIMMHMQGNPQNMQKNPQYDDIINDIIMYFSSKVQAAHQAGISDLIIDPGFGFGKTLAHNYELLQRLDAFMIFELPLMVGLSRKSMIYKYLDTSPGEALTGTIVLNTIALQKGASILRVHDVKETVETIKLIEKYKEFAIL